MSEPVPTGADTREWRVDVRDGKVRFALNGRGWPEDGGEWGDHGLTDEEIDETILLVPKSVLVAERTRSEQSEAELERLRARVRELEAGAK